MKDKLYLIIIALLSLYIIFLQQCSSPEIEYVPSDPVIITKTDTLRLPPDTVTVPGPTTYIPLPVPEPTQNEDSVNTYKQPFSDQYLSGVLQAQIQGTLLAWDFEYIPKVHYIRQKEFIYKLTTVNTTSFPKTEKTYTALLLGGGLHGNLSRQSFHGAIGISRGRFVYTYKYDPLQKIHMFSTMRKFSF